MKIRGGCIYFVAALDRSLIKIGFSSYPQGRFRQIRGASPVPLEFLASVVGTHLDEWKLHKVFLSARSHFEWFRATPEIMELIDQVRATGVLPEHLRGDINDARMGSHDPSVLGWSPEARAKASISHKKEWAARKARVATAGAAA